MHPGMRLQSHRARRVEEGPGTYAAGWGLCHGWRCNGSSFTEGRCQHSSVIAISRAIDESLRDAAAPGERWKIEVKALL
jgi:hypothetical protein